MPRLAAVLIVALTFAIEPTARGAGPADTLFRLVPPDAGLTLAIEDLRGHTRDFLASPLADAMGHLPAVVASRQSGQLGRLEKALKTIETLLGASLPKIRDDLLGDAIVLTLRYPPGRKPDEARGLLLVRPRDRALLDRLIEGINAAQLKSGELARVGERTRNGSSYSVREFRQAGRAAEYYTVLDDNTFAWSNSEELVQGVIDRKAGNAPGLAEAPKFRTVRDRLPGRLAVSLFADPVILGKLIPASATPRPSNPGERWLAVVITRYYRSLAYVGAGLQWRDGFILHTEETIDPARLDPGLLRLARTGPSRSPWRGVPPTALALASARVDLGAVLDIARAPLREPERIKLEDLLDVMGGLMLGRDMRTEILPRIGPGLSIFVDAPAVAEEGSRPAFPVVAAFDLKPGEDREDIAAAFDNALRTMLALKAFETRKGSSPRRVVSREVGSIKVTTLDANAPFAYALRPDRLTIGNPAAAVASGLGGDAPLDSPLAKLRAVYFPESDTFACADLVALDTLAGTFREPLARRLAARRKISPEAATREIDQALALVELFRGAFITSTMAPDASSVHRTLGLIARDPAAGRPWSDTSKPK